MDARGCGNNNSSSCHIDESIMDEGSHGKCDEIRKYIQETMNRENKLSLHESKRRFTYDLYRSLKHEILDQVKMSLQ